MLQGIFSFISTAASLVVAAVLLASFVFAVMKYREIAKIENEIFSLESEWDRVPTRKKRPVANHILIKIIEKERAPIERNIYILKQKRQFILDKIPLLALLRK